MFGPAGASPAAKYVVIVKQKNPAAFAGRGVLVFLFANRVRRPANPTARAFAKVAATVAGSSIGSWRQFLCLKLYLRAKTRSSSAKVRDLFTAFIRRLCAARRVILARSNPLESLVHKRSHNLRVSCRESSPRMPRRFINQFGSQEQINQVFLAAQKQLRPNRNGNLYLQVDLSDRSGIDRRADVERRRRRLSRLRRRRLRPRRRDDAALPRGDAADRHDHSARRGPRKSTKPTSCR